VFRALGHRNSSLCVTNLRSRRTIAIGADAAELGLKTIVKLERPSAPDVDGADPAGSSGQATG
jgi:hypothetical protein